MAHKIACGPSKLTIGGPDSDTVIKSINEIRKSRPSKDGKGPQNYDIKSPNDPWQFWLILTPALKYTQMRFTDTLYLGYLIRVLSE